MSFGIMSLKSGCKRLQWRKVANKSPKSPCKQLRLCKHRVKGRSVLQPLSPQRSSTSGTDFRICRLLPLRLPDTFVIQRHTVVLPSLRWLTAGR